MKVSYRQTQTSQEPEPQHPGSQQSQTQPGGSNSPGGRTSLIPDVSLQTTSMHGAPPPEIENGNLILYRRPNFFLRTAYRPGQKQNPLRKPSGHTTVMPKVMPHQETRIAGSETR